MTTTNFANLQMIHSLMQRSNEKISVIVLRFEVDLVQFSNSIVTDPRYCGTCEANAYRWTNTILKHLLFILANERWHLAHGVPSKYAV